MSAGPRFAVVLTLALTAAAPAAAAGGAGSGRAVEGFDRVRLLAPAGADVRDYENAGYRLRRIGDEVSIAVDTSALESSSRFAARDRLQAGPARRDDDPVARLARSLTAGSETTYQAISRVLAWTARSIRYDLDRSLSQDARAVLLRRSGYCTGVARLTVALLRSAGVPAREVAGYVVASADGGPAGFHRWIEAYLPDRGWVFSDPLRSHHYVPATYLRLASDGLEPAAGMEGLLLERRDRTRVVDLYPGTIPEITARRNSARRLAAALAVRIEGAAGGRAELLGSGARRTRTLVAGATTFVGLEPGRYALSLELPGQSSLERWVDLHGRVRKTLSLPGRDRPASNQPERGSE